MKNVTPWIIGGAVGAGVAWYFAQKRIANAYALGQANPTTAFASLTPAQLQQIGGAPLPSPPSAATQIASVGQQVATSAV